MPGPAKTRFDRDTAVEPLGGGRYRAHVDPGWWITGGPNGGYLAAILLRALLHESDDAERAPRTLTTHFTARAAEGPAELRATVERRGRTLSTATARLAQGDRLIALGLAALAHPRDGAAFRDLRMPQAPPPQEVEPRRLEPGASHSFRRRYETRPVAWPAQAGPLAGGWIRPEEPRACDALLAAALVDSWPPSLYAREGAPPLRGVPTVELTVHFCASLPPADARPDDFYLAVFRSERSSEGFLDEDGELWSRGGTLLARSRQLAVIG